MTTTTIILLILSCAALVFVFLAARKGKNPIIELFSFISTTMMGGERATIDMISAVVPYLVPVIPAYLTYYHASRKDLMDLPSWVALTAAIVVEGLGLASIDTAIKFRRHNLKYKSDSRQAPFTLAVIVYIAYIIVILLVNVIFETISGDRSGWVIAGIGLFSMLSIPSGVLISMRSEFADTLEEIGQLRKPKTQQTPTPTPADPKPKQRVASDFKEKMITMLDEGYKNGKILELTEITAKLKLDHEKSKGYVSTVRSAWMAENNIQKPEKKGPLSF